MMNNCRVNISIPDLRYVLILHSYYLKYQDKINSTVNLDVFYNYILNETDTFKELPKEYAYSVMKKFTEILPVLQQMKQYK